jgi:beta-lactamase regulating signal transducer with metallopeptidase domain
MENVLLYFAKANGLIILFYLMYVLFLRKETFFVSNRLYMILGLILSLSLPLITFTKTIWVDPTPVPEFYQEITPENNNAIEIPIQVNPLDWTLILSTIYVVISVVILLKIGIEIASFYNRIRKHNQQKEANFTLIHSNTSENPFSFFHYIVINPHLFSEAELQHIVTHESIHVKQKHSIDVLLGKLFCAVFWVNPIIWLYRKAMLQNLEFIADNETFQQIENKYEYQKTLLKVVTHQHDLSITNQFYQSLIKKRIVMLHTNQSHKRNAWKYATILPLLVGFMLLFQIETVAQVKENSKIVNTVEVEAIGILTDKNATDDEMKSDAELLKSQGIDYKFSNVKRNKNGEIIAIKIGFNDGKGNKGVKEIKGDDPIEPIYFNAEEGSIGFTTEPDYSDYVIDEKLSKIAGTEVKVKMYTTNKAKNTANWDEVVNKNKPNKLYIINGKEYLQNEISKGTTIEVDGAIIELSSEEGIKKYGLKAKDGVLIFEGKSTFITEEEQIKNIKIEIEKAEKEIKKAKIEIENAKPEIERAKLEIEKAKPEIEKAKVEIEKAKIEIDKNKFTKIIETENGDQSVIYGGNRLKIPGEPSIKIENGKLDIFVNGEKLKNAEDFLKMNHDKIYYIKAIEKETKENNIIVVKKIEIKTK